MTERDRNPDILATADRLAEMTGGIEYRRDAIYDALASSSASGAEEMREALKAARRQLVALAGEARGEWDDSVQRAVLDMIDAALPPPPQTNGGHDA